jgi:hypothetical protein
MQLTGKKPARDSKTVRGAAASLAVAIATIIAAVAGLVFDVELDVDSLAVLVGAIITAGGSALAIYGRVNATTRIGK